MTPAAQAVDDRKLLFEPVELLTGESGRCQPFLLFLIRDWSLPVRRVILEADVTVGGKVELKFCI